MVRRCRLPPARPPPTARLGAIDGECPEQKSSTASGEAHVRLGALGGGEAAGRW